MKLTPKQKWETENIARNIWAMGCKFKYFKRGMSVTIPQKSLQHRLNNEFTLMHYNSFLTDVRAVSESETETTYILKW